MDIAELYRVRAEELTRLAGNAEDEKSRTELLLKAKACLGVAARLKDYAAGHGFPLHS